MRKILLATLLLLIPITAVFSDNNPKTFTKKDIESLAGSYLGNLPDNVNNPAIVDVDKDGDFDILSFKDGNVAYYKNTGSLENPKFVMENKHYEKYQSAFFMDAGMPMPVFFADKDGDGDMDLFAVKDRQFNDEKGRFEHKVYAAENAVDLDTGTLITIILILVIVLLILAIAGK
jgi:hypothetical protein